MIRPASSSAAVTVVVSVLLMLSGCGHGGLDGSDQHAIRAALARWAAARTPAQACAVMSSGFRFFVGNGDYQDCASHFAEVLGAPVAESVTVESMREQNGQVAVHATVGGQRSRNSKVESHGPQVYWFVWQRDAWRLNSIGDRVGLGPPCHTYPGHPC